MTSSSAERAQRRNGGMGEILGGTLEAETAADAKKLDVAADSHRRGGDASDDAISDA